MSQSFAGPAGQWRLTTVGQVRGRNVKYSVGFPITEALREAIALVPATTWVSAIDPDGDARTGGDVADLAGAP